jgi:hypothetical protein
MRPGWEAVSVPRLKGEDYEQMIVAKLSTQGAI